MRVFICRVVRGGPRLLGYCRSISYGEGECGEVRRMSAELPGEELGKVKVGNYRSTPNDKDQYV